MAKILICGFCNKDIINRRSYFGGAAGGIALNLSNFLKGVGILSAIGNDPFSRKYLNEFRKRGIDTSLLSVSNKKISTLKVINRDNEEKARKFTSFGIPEEVALLRPDPSKLNKFTYLHVENTPKELADNLADNFKGVISYCPGSWFVRTPDSLSIKLLRKTGFLFCNEEEFNLLKSRVNLDTLLKKNLKICCATLGGKGLYMMAKGQKIHIDRYKAKKYVDSTGAGDAVIVGFLKEVVSSRSYEEGLKEGLKLASQIIQKHGIVLTQEDILRASRI